ncbi:hypothetical protein EJ05DRAFT_480560 [Pseudovirgaria hyperparasitica]|uniref:Uncharacterized protein n=1 Tax=Pseudovirgaria hyperparasitica TaxID=470096 RepID=A0A6A6VTS6_9PEZI|nr:uncharacterized protein EJ05DRAFT_480560 [Pseudovirgaria hyperparasitica]KAF2753196.1 hypothetical protein EJ05DRAFT_480560 [Pseudovirgaria hyperparasitica]
MFVGRRSNPRARPCRSVGPFFHTYFHVLSILHLPFISLSSPTNARLPFSSSELPSPSPSLSIAHFFDSPSPQTRLLA